MKHRLARLALAATAVSLSACIMVPRTQAVYDPGCQVVTQEVVLEPAVLPVFGYMECGRGDCAAAMAALGLVTAASVVVSGSIALVGNVLYWAEKQGNCRRSPVAALAPERTSSAPAQ
jgi:hypothetical protein